MKEFQVVITAEAKSQMREYLSYIKIELKNPQAVRAVRDDWKETTKQLRTVAGSLPLCSNPKLAIRNLHKIHFQRHSFVMLFRINGDTAEVVNIYHDLQDYENY